MEHWAGGKRKTTTVLDAINAAGAAGPQGMQEPNTSVVSSARRTWDTGLLPEERTLLEDLYANLNRLKQRAPSLLDGTYQPRIVDLEPGDEQTEAPPRQVSTPARQLTPDYVPEPLVPRLAPIAKAQFATGESGDDADAVMTWPSPSARPVSSTHAPPTEPRRRGRLNPVVDALLPWRKTLILGGVALALIAVEMGGCQREAPPSPPAFVPQVIQPFGGGGIPNDMVGGTSDDPIGAQGGSDVGGAGVPPGIQAEPTPPSMR